MAAEEPPGCSQAVGYTCHPRHQGRGGEQLKMTPDLHMEMHVHTHVHRYIPKKLTLANMEALACAHAEM